MSQSNRGVIVAFLIGGAALLGVSLFAYVVRQRVPERAPAIRFIRQADGAGMRDSEIWFVTDAQLHSTSQGWMAGDLHPHALIDNTMIMPMQNDIRAVGGDTFALHPGRLMNGSHTIRLFWADGAHVATGDTAVTVVNIEQ
jgi:hypothetical protein